MSHLENNIIFYGNVGAGKSAIVIRFLNPDDFISDFDSNVEDCYTMVVNSENLQTELQILDTVDSDLGTPSLDRVFLRKSKAILLVYDVTDPESLSSLVNRAEKLLKIVPADSGYYYLVGNKIDLKKQLENSENNPEPQAENNQEPYFENIPEIFLDTEVSPEKPPKKKWWSFFKKKPKRTLWKPNNNLTVKENIMDLYGITPCHCFEVSAKENINIKELRQAVVQNIFEQRCRKPVIYLYPPVPTPVSVVLDLDGKLSHAFPKPMAIQKKNHINYQWDVEAKPNGDLIIGDKKYSYLFWEGTEQTEFDMEKGFIVKGEETVEFLEAKLGKMGLNRREMNEFIVYWMPILEENEYNFICFQFEQYTNKAKLEITPKPKHIIRIFMTFTKLNAEIIQNNPNSQNIQEQILPEINRKELDQSKEFVVVEWGGTEISVPN